MDQLPTFPKTETAAAPACRPLSIWLLGVLLYGILIVPAVCLATVVAYPNGPVDGLIPAAQRWQSEAGQLLRWQSLVAFLPLWSCAALCICLLLYDERRMVRWWLVRLGVYTGMILSANFIGLYLCAVFGPFTVDLAASAAAMLGIGMMVLVPPFYIGVVVTRWISARSARGDRVPGMRVSPGPLWRGLFIGLFGLSALALTFSFVYKPIFMPASLFVAWVLTCVVGPFFTGLAYTVMSYRAWISQGGRFRFSLDRLFFLIGWFCLFMAAWRFALNQLP